MEVILSWYQVENLEQAKQFYGQVLGLKQVFAMDGWVEFSHADGAAAVGLMQAPDNATEPGATVVFRVNDLAQAQADLSERGAKFEGEVEEIPGVVRIATFRDPSGNRLQLVQPLTP